MRTVARRWGSGSFLGLGNRVFILTNEHVATVRAGGRTFASQLKGPEDIWRIAGDHAEHPAPLDLAVLPVPDAAWSAPHGSAAIKVDRIALAHRPVEGELLAFSGFPGERV